MLAICGECSSETDHDEIALRASKNETVITLQCKCGHQWEEDVPQIIGCKNCEDV
jgi:hypothetical protein